MLTPSWVNRAFGPSNRVYAPKSPSNQRPSFALTTNHPSDAGTMPSGVDSYDASGTTNRFSHNHDRASEWPPFAILEER